MVGGQASFIDNDREDSFLFALRQQPVKSSSSGIEMGCSSVPPGYITDEIMSFNISMNILNVVPVSIFTHHINKSKNNSCSKGPGYRPAKI